MGTKHSSPVPAATDFVPSESVLVVRQNPETHQRESVMLRWGLVPPWAESPAIGHYLAYARAETVLDKAVFREAFRHRRCLIVVDSFQLSRRRPLFAIQMKDGHPFGLGGIWEQWRLGDEQIESCAVITTQANDLVLPINERMPVIVPPEDYGQWIDSGSHDWQRLEQIMQPYPDENMVVVDYRR